MVDLPRTWRRCILSMLLLPWAAQAADDFDLFADAPVALAWSASEVEGIGNESLRALLERAARDDQLGCLRMCERLQGIFDRLLVVARKQTPRSARLGWSLNVVRTPAVDAVSFPGGQVVVSEDFVAGGVTSEGDEALAFVLAHEMAHCVLEHERQALTVARMLLPRDVSRSVSDIYTEMDFNFALLKSLEPAMQEGELQADELGFLMASAAGFAPQRQLDFLAQEARRDEGARTPIMDTHPSAALRLQRLRDRLPLAQRIFAAGLLR